VRGDWVPAPLATDGPLEIAAVAGSFNRMAQRLRDFEANRALLLAGISHDLRTPLAKIRLALALGPGLEPDAETLIDAQFDQLDALLGQFLDFGRWMDGETAAVRDIAADVRAVAAEIDPALAATIAAAPVSMTVRPMALRRGIANMIENARRHGAAPIEISISISAAEVAICVDDRGPGVPDALLPGLATPFVHGGAAGSTGLGLAIVRHVAQAHEGRLILGNRPGGGFRQRLELPRR
jgi:two-component system, OmpR family, osmolarity sensor histidine kinase EnvZ